MRAPSTLASEGRLRRRPGDGAAGLLTRRRRVLAWEGSVGGTGGVAEWESGGAEGQR